MYAHLLNLAIQRFRKIHHQLCCGFLSIIFICSCAKGIVSIIVFYLKKYMMLMIVII